MHYVLADDLGSVATVVKAVAPHALNYLWGKVKNTKLVNKARDYLRDYLGIDLNDD